MPTNQIQCNLVQSSEKIDKQLRQFWEIEEISLNKQCLSDDEISCENLFIDTTQQSVSIMAVFQCEFPLMIHWMRSATAMKLHETSSCRWSASLKKCL